MFSRSSHSWYYLGGACGEVRWIQSESPIGSTGVCLPETRGTAQAYQVQGLRGFTSPDEFLRVFFAVQWL